MRGVAAKIAATAVLIGAALAALIWPRLFPPSPAEVLGGFLGEARWSEGRSALGLPWRPWRGGEKLQAYGPVLAALYHDEEAGDLPLALAQLYLWRGDTGDLDRAEKHLAGLPTEAKTLNERSLLLLARAQGVEALETIEHAFELAPLDPAVLFNRAIVREHLGLTRMAAEAWEAFLGVEPAGPWAAEARERAAALATAEAPPGDLELRLAKFEGAIAHLDGPDALAALRGDPATAVLLDELLQRGERLPAALLTRLQSLDAAAWRERRRWSEAYTREREKVLSGTADLRALEALGEVSDPLIALRFNRLALYDAVQRQDVAAARRLYERIAAICLREGCVEAVVLARSDLASLLVHQGRFHEAEQEWRHAAEALPETATVRRAELVSKRSLLAWRTGAFREATELAIDSARGMRRDPVGSATPLVNAGFFAMLQGKLRAAEVFCREALLLSRQVQVVRTALIASRTLADIRLDRGDLQGAASVLDETREDAEETGIVPVLQSNRLSLARIRLQQVRLSDARTLLERVLAEEEARNLQNFRVEALELLARVSAAEGKDGEALRFLEKAVAVADEQVAHAPSPLAAQRMWAETGSTRLALAERHAARADAAAFWRILGGAELRELAPDECFVAETRLDVGWGLWVATSEGTRLLRGEAPLSPLQDGACPAGVRRISLLDRSGLDSAALWRRLRDEAPGVALVASSGPERPWPAAQPSGPALAVHSPQPVELRSGLGFLPAAPKEAAIVRGAFPGSRELRGMAATPAAVLAQAGAYGLLHFGVHGEARLGKGAASYLLLGGELGRLEVATILEMPLRERRPVVVLSACRSGGTVVDRERDGAGLGWAFLEAGARAVVSYQDALDDEVALLFSAAFYDALGRGADLSAAFESAVAKVRQERSAAAAARFVLSI